MIKKSTVQLLIVSLLFCCKAFSQRYIDVQHYKFSIELNDRNDTVYGEAEIKLKFLQPANSFPIDLVLQNTKGKGMIIDKIILNGIVVRDFSKETGRLIISSIRGRTVPGEVSRIDSATLVILYHGIPADGLIISKNKYGDRTFFADNWPNRAHNWIPCVDDPADKASFEFIVTAPSHYQVISNGTKTEEKEIGNDKKLTHWKEDVSLPTKVMVIGVAKFAIKQFADSPPGIPVSAWVYPQDSTKGFINYSVAPAILKFLSAYIGPYPYEKLANVQSKTIFGGMENASAIFYDEGSASSSRTVESLLAHEIVHQWFGDMATEKSFPHLWLSEGFATYLTHFYIESKYGTDSLEAEMKKDRKQIIDFVKESSRPVVDSVSSFMSLLNANSYQKGGWVLHMLRHQLGDSVFHKIIRSYYAAYAGKNADTRDFQKICEKESGKNLQSFFDQWLYTPGLPKLQVQWSYSEKNKNVIITVTQLQKDLFRFPLDIQLQAPSGKSQWETLQIAEQTQQFSIPVKEKTRQLSPDPKTFLLFESSVSPTNQ
jgi:aminopeptidase N